MTERSRKLSPLDATLLVMGGIIGVGIFFNPHSVAELVATPGVFLGLWAVGGVLALCGAFTFAELGATFPRAGGWFVYLREAFGPGVAFLFAWVVLFVVSTGALSVVATFCASNLVALLAIDATPAIERATAAVILLGLTGLTLCGIKVGATFQNACMLIKLGAIGVLVVAGLALYTAAPDAAPTPVRELPPPPLWKGVILAMLPVLFSYGGWQMLGYTATEVENPRRTLPRAILFGVLAVVLVYLAINLAFLRVLGLEELATNPGFAAELARRTLGGSGERFLHAAMAVSSLGVCMVIVLSSPWIYVAMAREGLFFRRFGDLHSKTGAPVLGLCLQCTIALAYLLFVGEDLVNRLTGTVVFAEWFFHALVALGLLSMRRRRPELERPFLAPRIMPALYFLLASAIVIGNLIQGRLETTGTGLVVLAVGALVYALWRRRISARR